MNVSESFSMPFVALTIGRVVRDLARDELRDLARRVARRDEDHHRGAAASTSSGSTLAVSVCGSFALGRYLPLTCSSLICVDEIGTPAIHRDRVALVREDLRERRSPRARAKHRHLVRRRRCARHASTISGPW